MLDTYLYFVIGQPIKGEVVCVRVVLEGRACTKFVAMVPVQHAHAKGILHAIDNAFDSIGLPKTDSKFFVERLVAPTAVGHAVNMGIKNGVQTKL